MTPIRMAALAACLLAPAAAHAEDTYIVDHVVITGSHTVPKEKLLAAIKSHPGARVTREDIVADQTAISKVLEEQHVAGGIKTSMAALKNHITITFAVDDQGAQAPVVTTVAPKLSRQVFAGNVTVPSTDLEAATALKAGQDLTNDQLTAAQQAILALYKKANKVTVSVSASTKKSSDGTVEIDWQITETAGKPEKKKRRQSGAAGFEAEP